MSNLTIVTNPSGSASIMTVNGHVDSQTATQLDDALSALASKGTNKIVVNLGELAYMSSAGVRALVKAAKAMKAAGGELKLAAMPEMVKSVMYTVGLDKIVNLYATVDEAMASF